MNHILLFGMPGGGELFFIVLVIIMFFGSKKIPELARGLGKGMREIKNATGDIQREIREGARDINSVKDTVDVEKQVKDLIKEDKENNQTTTNNEKQTKDELESDTSNEQQGTSHEQPKPETIKRRSPYTNEESQNTSENL